MIPPADHRVKKIEPRHRNKYELLRRNTLDEILLLPFQYIASLPGKQIRSKLIHALNEWLKVDEEKLEKISEIIELLHTASLL